MVFPLVDPVTHQTTTPTSRNGAWCDENFYAPSHQTYNVWSYDMVSDKPFADLGQGIKSEVSTGGTTTTIEMKSGMGYEMSSSFKNQISTSLEYKYENSLNIPLIGEAYDFSFRAYAKGSYGYGEYQHHEHHLFGIVEA